MHKITSTAPDLINQHSSNPWQQMRGMRNVAIHEYFYVDLAMVWTTVIEDFPPLKRQIHA